MSWSSVPDRDRIGQPPSHIAAWPSVRSPCFWRVHCENDRPGVYLLIWVGLVADPSLARRCALLPLFNLP